MKTMKKEMLILDVIRTVSENALKCKLSEGFFNENKADLEKLSLYFNSTPIQSVLLAGVLTHNIHKGAAGVDDLSGFFGCNALYLLQYKPELDYLLQTGLLKKTTNSRNKNKVGLTNIYFYIPEDITEAILANKPIPETETETVKDILDLLEMIYNMGWTDDEDGFSTQELINKTIQLVDEHRKFPLLKKLKRFNLSDIDLILMLHLYWLFVNGEAETDLELAVYKLQPGARDRFKYIKGLFAGQHPLIKQELVIVQKNRFLEDSVVRLSEKATGLLLNDDLKIALTRIRRNNTVLPSEISVKELIFNREEAISIEKLTKSLTEANLKKIQNRMKSRNLPSGFTVLFYGEPGTGKTESVYQIARQTGREIMYVDISKSKSSWFGESEKLIKKVFAEYNAFMKETTPCPVLLFNEADAIFSRRKNVEAGNVAQTENAIQNIILQELETFSGILFATTNMVTNFDKAFERRFLFKLRFPKPDLPSRAKIWKLKLPDLLSEEADYLAENFHLSGGQIDNIVRKCEITRILDSKKESLDELISFCHEEVFDTQITARIGFIS